MSCGVPVVASNIGGIPEVVGHGESGFVAELGDINRMAKYVCELLENQKKWEIFSDNARLRAVEKFDSSIIIPRYINLYERLMSSGA
jgi:L-malate glycosyltransferase